MDITIGKFGSRSFFQMNGESIEIKDYKISSSMHGSTELEVVFEFEGDFTEFLSKVNSTDDIQKERVSDQTRHSF